MPFTTKDNITGDIVARTRIEDFEATFYRGHTFFYAEDIMVVLNQRISGERSQLRMVDITFEREDGGHNHNIHKVVGLALEEVDENDNHVKWYDKIGVAWPPYYHPDTSALVDEREGSFKDQRFEGSDEYIPGHEIHK